jgi:hypothetical protein
VLTIDLDFSLQPTTQRQQVKSKATQQSGFMSKRVLTVIHHPAAQWPAFQARTRRSRRELVRFSVFGGRLGSGMFGKGMKIDFSSNLLHF